MKKERLYLLLGILLAMSTVFAGGVTMEKDTELHATNLTFKINNTIMFESPVQISNDGYAIFGTQNFSVTHSGIGQLINITVLNYTNSSVGSGVNFWFFIEGENRTVNITLNNIPGAVRGISETDSSGTTITSSITSTFYSGSVSLNNFNATDTGKYIKVEFSTPTTTTLSSGGGSGGGSSSFATTTILEEITTTTLQEEPVTTTTLQEEEPMITTTTIPSEETKKPPLKLVTIGVLIVVTLAVIFWLFQSLKGEQKPKSGKSKNLN